MTQVQSVSPSPELCLVAPVDGVVVPLESLPDPVFAEKMLGDGLAIDPTGTEVVSPCAGVVAQLHRAHHALTIKTDEGISILVHVGLDTVNLKGEGFKPHVKEGDTVAAGTRLLSFDLDVIAKRALSAQVEIVVTEGGDGLVFKRQAGMVAAGEDEILRISRSPISRARPTTQVVSGGSNEARLTATVRNPNGMHARPAARLGQIAKQFDAAITLHFGEKSASATSVADIMALDLAKGDAVTVAAQGPAAEAAALAIQKGFADGLGENPDESPAHEAAQKLVTSEDGVIGGVPASPGLSIGTVVRRSTDLPHFEETAGDRTDEIGRIRIAIEKVCTRLDQEIASFSKGGFEEKAQIFAAQKELLEDQGLVKDAESPLGEGASAERAWLSSVEARVKKLGSLKNPLLRQRASDMNDVGRRVLFALVEKEEPELVLTSESILVCDDLTPSVAASLDEGKIGGIITELGGSTSHAAIIARSMGVPYVAGVGAEVTQLTEGLQVILDGTSGAITIDPDDAAIERAEAEIARRAAEKSGELKRAHEKAVTLDGFEVEVGANIGSAKDSQESVAKGCDGVGLLRSEFLFLGRREAPTEVEQKSEYEQIAKALGPTRSLVIRTLDVGGDKPLSYMPLEEEENPFLGIRGLRLSLKYPKLFRSQLRAALAAAAHTKLHLMFPMVAQPSEFSAARAIVLEEMDALGIDRDAVSIGVMVEVPSAALNAQWLAKEADFFSIGTNDLTQYTLAMDRGHSELSKKADAFEPAVLRLIQMTVEAAHAEGKWVGVCGGLAAEPLATPLLLGLDINELSVPAPVIPELKARIRNLEHDACRAVAEGALALPGAAQVRALLTSFLASQRS